MSVEIAILNNSGIVLAADNALLLVVKKFATVPTNYLLKLSISQ